jgi:Zn2+/Cd2+-exporting ATPase
VFSARVQLCAALAAGLALVVAFGLHRLSDAGGAHLAAQILNWTALAIGLVYGGRAAGEALAQKQFDIDVLMVLGALLAAWLDAPAEGALLLFLFTLSGALEDLAMARTTRAVEALSALIPTAAIRWTGAQPPTAAQSAAQAGWEHVAPEGLLPGDLVRILPGERVPTDARVMMGEAAINQATLTGESMPREVGPGDEIFAGTINTTNPLVASVLRPAAQSALQKILHLVTQAQQQREPVQRFIDRVSQPYAWSVLAASIATFAVFHLLVGHAWKDALYTAITLLIVASPCALIIATPTATLAGISRAARGGVLFKGGQSIERLARMNAVALDKTGTLTLGRPSVTALHPIAWSDGTHLLAIAAGLEVSSTHPIAEAILAQAKALGIAHAPATGVRSLTGKGIAGAVGDAEARLGSLAHTQDLIPVCFRNQVKQTMAAAQAQGAIAVVVAWKDQVGVITLADSPRPGAEHLVQRLHAARVHPVVMLTGDHPATANHIAQALSIDTVHAELLPADKVRHLQELKQPATAGGPARRVGVIGDGVNDAPALAAADVAIAIGSIGSDAALESADIVLLADDLRAVPWAVVLARRVRLTISVNLVFALAAIVLMAATTVIGAALGWRLPLWMGVVGHEGGTLLVVAHSLSLLLFPAVQLNTPGRVGHAPVHDPLSGAAAATAPGTALPGTADSRAAETAPAGTWSSHA